MIRMHRNAHLGTTRAATTISATLPLAAALLFAAAPAAAKVPAKPASPAEATGALEGEVERIDGRRVFVRGDGVRRWQVGLAVTIREAGPSESALVLCEGRVVSVAGERAIVELPEGAPALTVGARVEPRFVAEARRFGAAAAIDKAAGAAAEGDANPAEPVAQPQVWHQPPRAVPYGGKVWLEVVATKEHRALVVRWRLGDAGPFQDAPMQAGADGRWTAEIALPAEPDDPDPDGASRGASALRYYIGAEIHRDGKAPSPEVIVGHAADPVRVPIASAPGGHRRASVDHEPPPRWSDHEALTLTARIDKRFREPTIFHRPRGGGRYERIPMQKVHGDLYRATIPARFVVVPGLAYYIGVRDARGVERPGFGSARSPYRVSVTRGTVLSPEASRNRFSFGLSTVRYGGSDDATVHTDIGLERMFFSFLVGRLAAEADLGRAPRADVDGVLAPARVRLYGGSAGLELRLGDYFSVGSDLWMAIHGEGAGLGYALAGRIGDESGSHITASWRALYDLDSGDDLVETLRVALSIPVGRALRLDGVVVHEALLTDASKGLRFAVEATFPVGSRVTLTTTAGFAGRDADRPGFTGGARIGLLF